MRALINIALVLCLMAPNWAIAQSAKDPLSYSIRTYGLMLALSLLGGFASWYAKVHRQELKATNLFALVGELATSALSGLIVFYGCESLDVNQLLTAALVGVAGHMGNKLLSWAEEMLKRRGEQVLGGPPNQ